MTDEFDSDIQNQDDPYLLKIDLQNCRDQWHEHALKQGLEIVRLRAEAEENKVVLDLCGNTERHLRDKAAGLFMEGEKKDGQIAALTAQLELTKGLQPNYFHDSHKAVDAFWKVWNEVGEPHKHGVYESTWMALRAAIEAIEDTNND